MYTPQTKTVWNPILIEQNKTQFQTRPFWKIYVLRREILSLVVLTNNFTLKKKQKWAPTVIGLKILRSNIFDNSEKLHEK